MPLPGPTHIPSIGEQTDPDKVRVAAVVGGHLASAPARGFGLTVDELTALQDLTALSDFGTGVIVTTVVTSSGTYTRPTGLRYLEVSCWGGGGAGGGTPATAAGQATASAGGHGGALAYSRLTAAEVGASQTVTIGAGGTGVVNAAGNNGGNTSFGTLVIAAGGLGSPIGTLSAPPLTSNQSVPVQSSAGQIRGWSVPGSSGTCMQVGVGNRGGVGGNTIWGGAGAHQVAAAVNTGSGGGGSAQNQSLGTTAGGAGGSGIVVLKEYF